MTSITFQPTTLDSEHFDTEAVLAYREGRLLAVLTCLGDLHGELQGQWFVEAMFSGEASAPGKTFEELAEFERWVAADQPSAPSP